MQYLVVIEDTKQLCWQTELLYESIKLLDLEDQFIVAICPSNGKCYKHRYSNIVYFENIGEKMNFPHFNKCYGLAKAIESGKLKQPFVVLEPDMFLLRPIPESSSYCCSQRHSELKWDLIKNNVKGLIHESFWDNIGGVYQFNKVPLQVFGDIVGYTNKIYLDHGTESRFHTYGFNVGILINGVKVEIRDDYEMPLMYNGSPDVNWNSHIVHYKKGFPPYFVKNNVYNTINFSFDMPLPFKTILDLPVKNQPNVAAMQKLVRSWLDSNLSGMEGLL